VVQQDFAYYHPIVATNHLAMWRLRDSFEWRHHCPESSSVLFFCKKPVEAESLARLAPGAFTLEMIHEAYDYSLGCVRPEARVYIETAKLGFLIQQGHADAALKQLPRVVARPEQLFPDLIDTIEREAVLRATVEPTSAEWLREIQQWAAQTKARLQ
jgi:hypothetical protein